MKQKHIIKLTVELKAVRLLVRFPCKLTFQLKTDRAQVSSANSYELCKGECTLNQILEAEAEVTFDSVSGQYEEANTRIILQMTSSNGVIPAGSVSFNPFNNQKIEETLLLQKCPDRSAQITFCQSFQILRKNVLEDINQSQYGNIGSKLSRLRQKNPSSKEMSQSKSGQDKYSRNGLSNSPNLPITLSKSRDVSRNKIKSPASNFQRSPNLKYPHFQSNDLDQPQDDLQTSQIVHKETLSSRKYAQSYLQPNDKAQYLKEISKLKAELKSLQNEDRINQLKTVKEENQHLEAELDKNKEKLRIFQRKQRENNIQLKEAKQESERNKSKYLQSQSLRNESQVMLTEKEKVFKEMQTQIKRLEQQLQDFNVQLSNQQKRIQFKQNSYQDQLKKVSQRYTHSENQRQKATFDYNTLLAKLEETEKKNQASVKDKDRSYTEDKGRLNKKIDQLTQTLNSLNEQHKEQESLLIESINQCKILTKRQREKQQKMMAISAELELNKMMLSKEQEQTGLMQKEIVTFKIIEQERNSLKKRNSELNSQIAKNNDKIERLSSDLSFSQAKVRELENTLIDRTKQKDSLNTKYNSTKKELDSLKREEERKMRETETLSVQNFNAGQKINELKSKMQAERRDKDELKHYYDEQIAYLAKGKEYSEHQIQQFKQSLEKTKQQYEQATNRLRSLNQEILHLNEEILVCKQRIKRNQSNNQQLTKDIESLKNQIIELEEKQKQLNDQLRLKGDTIYELQKKYQTAENQLYMLRQKLKQSESSSEDRRSYHEKHLKDREKHLGVKQMELAKLTIELANLKEEIQSLTKQSAIKSNEIISLKDYLQTARQNIINKDIKEQQVRDQLQNNYQMLQNLRGEHDLVCKNLEEEKKTREKIKKEWDDYRTATAKALQQFIQYICKDEEKPSQSLLSFPDSTISVMQVEAIKKKNALFNRYHMIIQGLQQDKALLQAEIVKQGKFVAAKEQAIESIRQSESKKYKQSISQLQSHQQQLQLDLESMQQQILQLTTDLQKYNIEIKKKEDFILQLQDQITVTVEERQFLRNQLHTAEHNIIALKSSQIKWKANHESQITDLSGHNESTIQIYKITISDLQAKISLQEKVNKEKDSAIKNIHAKISDLSFEKEKLQILSLQLSQKCSDFAEEKKSLEKKLKNVEKQLKETSSQLDDTRRCAQHEKNKLNEIQAKLRETHANLLEIQIENEKIKADLLASLQKNKNQEESSQEKTDKLKAIIERSDKQIKELKDFIIGLNSTIELKDFQITQSEKHISSLQENGNEAKEQLIKKKAQIIRLGDKLQQCKNQILYNAQNIQILITEKQFLSDENDRLKDRTNILEDEINDLQHQIETINQKQRELLKLKEELETVKLQKEEILNQMKLSPLNHRKISEQDYTTMLQLEELLQIKNLELSTEAKQLLKEYHREKRNLINQNNALKQQIDNLQSQFDFTKIQLKQQIQSLTAESEKLCQELTNKNVAQQKLIEGITNSVSTEQIQYYVANIKKILNHDYKGIAQEEPHSSEYPEEVHS